MSFLRLKDVTITCKHMRHSLSIDGSSSVQWRKVGGSWRLRMCFRRLLCVRIEIDQLQCMNCWVIIHCLSVSCTKINHFRCADLLYNWPPNSELLLNNSLLELIYFLNVNKNEILLLEDFSDYNQFPKFHPIIYRLHVNKRFSIIIDHRNNTNESNCKFMSS